MVRASRAISMSSLMLLSLPTVMCSGRKASLVLHPPSVQREQRAKVYLEHHVHQLLLSELDTGDSNQPLFRISSRSTSPPPSSPAPSRGARARGSCQTHSWAARL